MLVSRIFVAAPKESRPKRVLDLSQHRCLIYHERPDMSAGLAADPPTGAPVLTFDIPPYSAVARPYQSRMAFPDHPQMAREMERL
jgi:hypothetical protein